MDNALPFAPTQIGTVPFLNAKPLVWDLERKFSSEIQQLPPRLIPGSLLRGQLSVALLSSAFSILNPEAITNKTFGIGCTGAVESILLFSECPWDQITKVYLDATSIAANNLLQVLFKQKSLGTVNATPPLWITPSLEQLDLRPTPDGSSAYLLIGDRALSERHQHDERFGRVYDLGEEWLNFTGLPFVFALWTYKPGLNDSTINSMNKIIERTYFNFDLELFVQNEAEKYPDLSSLQIKKYLSQTIQYQLSADHLKGYALYKKWMLTAD